MNDDHREDPTASEWSSRTAGAGTATAEPVDHRWFEEALRAQGFLVEAPDTHDEPSWPGIADVEPLSTAAERRDEDDLAVAEAEAVLETEPLTAEPEVGFAAETEPFAAEATPQAEPWDLAPIARPPTSWPVIGTTPARLVSAPPPAATEQPVVSAARQAVAPATLPQDVLPVPSAALAARLARPSGWTPITPAATSAPSLAPMPDSSSAAAETVAPVWAVDEIAPADEAPATSSATSVATDPWTLPALQADLAAEPAVKSEPATTVEAVATHEMDVALAVATAATVVDAPPVEATAPPVEATAPPVEATAPPVEAIAAVAQPATPFSPPIWDIAAVASRPAAETVGTTVDGGDSELWGLVGDPAKPSTTAGAAPATKSSPATTALLTIFVAIVVVALVLGFIYLFTSLL